ncbi:hypothetical protein CPB86DRAFT_407575 [Serendipita vermifera]|nr:hypothetical protein CPB86DRAFT_407575 [Serendipita vermifera]
MDKTAERGVDPALSTIPCHMSTPYAFRTDIHYRRGIVGRSSRHYTISSIIDDGSGCYQSRARARYYTFYRTSLASPRSRSRSLVRHQIDTSKPLPYAVSGGSLITKPIPIQYNPPSLRSIRTKSSMRTNRRGSRRMNYDEESGQTNHAFMD